MPRTSRSAHASSTHCQKVLLRAHKFISMVEEPQWRRGRRSVAAQCKCYAPDEMRAREEAGSGRSDEVGRNPVHREAKSDKTMAEICMTLECEVPCGGSGFRRSQSEQNAGSRGGCRHLQKNSCLTQNRKKGCVIEKKTKMKSSD